MSVKYHKESQHVVYKGNSSCDPYLTRTYSENEFLILPSAGATTVNKTTGNPCPLEADILQAGLLSNHPHRCFLEKFLWHVRGQDFKDPGEELPS